MQTGEGKTLVATLPVFLNALAGRGVHVVTVNDYLARRDAEWMGPLYEFHGLTVDCIDKHQPNSEARRQAYKCDVTFGTNNEFGFDYLRDNMAMRPEQLVQRKHHFAIVDEVDSVLIDEARTPLIISGPTPKGDEHEFDQLKPKVVSLVQVQQKAAQGFLAEAKKKLVDGASKEEVEEGGLALYRAYRALPKSKPLIKFLSQDGMRQQLLKTEGYYLADNQREMHKADADSSLSSTRSKTKSSSPRKASSTSSQHGGRALLHASRPRHGARGHRQRRGATRTSSRRSKPSCRITASRAPASTA